MNGTKTLDALGGVATSDVVLPDGPGQTLTLPLLSVPFRGPPWGAGQAQSLLFLKLTRTAETPTPDQCFQESAPGTPDSPKSKSAALLGSAPHTLLRGLVCRGAVGGDGGALVSVHCATAPEVLIKLRLQEKQKLHSHFGRP